MNRTPTTLFPLHDLAVLQATGADAIAFLHGQLTQDVEGLPEGQARLAGYCTAKGRLLGSLLIWKTPQQDGDTSPVLRALVKADLAQALAKRISMFILRAKVKIEITNLPVYGLIRHAQEDQASLPGLPGFDEAQWAALPAEPAPWSVAMLKNDWQAIGAPSAQPDMVRWWLIPSLQASEQDKSPHPGLEDSAEDTAPWHAADIAAGLPWVQAATQDLFIPQTLNFDLIDGVNFTKGCYPGQEVVARAHYRGTVKRRMAYGKVASAKSIDAAALPGMDTYDALRPDNPCGRIVNAALNGETLHVLMETQLADLGQADYRLESANGLAIQPFDLPYPLKVEA
ncbi:YgfZ/GcvT domain-containing protein [Allopusillimonas ginsengisoli]|uniref:CAF17-like 4Fe-4S cluster assembly/insertion protein YgfZ n=1 Tax=Allopusillimonas ginsengisoli TaxID=453575 RepID=UPI00101FAD77|nr:folate-binding protein YgfZ [Allopusillimonas ginsengisoli]TEA77618.1 folate-binding protein [Allopusillimonas ginsengisoli]